MSRMMLAVAAAALLAPLGPPWVKLDVALVAASRTDKLVAVYVPLPATDNPEDSSSAEADQALLSKAVAKRYGEFFWVKVTDKATVKRIDAPSSGTHLVFVDPDGVPIGVWNLHSGGEGAVLKALTEAKALYQPKSVPWFEGELDEKGDKARRKLVVYAFLDDKEPSEKVVKALEHPWVARDHNRLVLVRTYLLDSPLAKRFKVTSVPTLIFFDPSQKEGNEIVLRRSGEVAVRLIRAQMKKVFARIKKQLEEGK